MIHTLTNPFSALTVMCHSTDCNAGNTLSNIEEDCDPKDGRSSGSWRVHCVHVCAVCDQEFELVKDRNLNRRDINPECVMLSLFTVVSCYS